MRHLYLLSLSAAFVLAGVTGIVWQQTPPEQPSQSAVDLPVDRRPAPVAAPAPSQPHHPSPAPTGTNPKPIQPLRPAADRPTPAQPPQPQPIPAWKADILKTLKQAGWKQPALDRVVELNAAWFALLHENEPDALAEQVRCLKRLGRWPQVMRFLKSFPETAGLLATADNPEALVEILDTDHDQYRLLVSLFVRYHTRQDIAALAAGLKDNRDLVCRLIGRGLLGSEALFMFPRTERGSSEYEEWLRDNLNSRLNGSDEELASFIQFALLQGRDLLDQLSEDESFRDRFAADLWPKLLRVVERKKEPLELYVDAPNLWRLLALEEGEKLLERRGMLAAALLFGPDAYPKDLQDRVVRILLAGDGVTFHALTDQRWRKQDEFHQLLRRGLDDRLLAAALNKLYEQGPNYRPLLAKYNQLNAAELAEEVGPPPQGGIETWLPLYAEYRLASKLWGGKEVTTEDWVDAGIDAASILAGPLRPGGKIVTQLLKQGLTRKSIEYGVAAGRKYLGNQTAEQLAQKGTEWQVQRWTVSRAFTEMQRIYRTVGRGVEKNSALEITHAVRLCYRHSHLGRESFKRLTALEARLFMRSDAKVYVQIDRLACNQARDYINSWLRDQEQEPPGDGSDERTWQQHLAAWWLLNTGDPVLLPRQ
jgi:hypothetical protein